jgi:hypothetical protein
MQRIGHLDLPLHYGKMPKWLFEKMKVLAREISEIIIIEFGKDYLLERLADPHWFQSFGCVLGFDWHSSGLTTTVCGALKEAFRDLRDYGIYVCGGKGTTSRKTPQEIEEIGNRLGRNSKDLIYASKIVAKVDNNALQDGFNLYHHSFIFTNEFSWVVIQQGMSQIGNWARRYHWYSKDVNSFVREPHKGIVSDTYFLTLNMVDNQKDKLRSLVSEISQRKPEKNLKELLSLKDGIEKLPQRHRIFLNDINPKYLGKIFLKTYQERPSDFESLLCLEGVGAKTIRALALICDLIYGESISFRDPARFSFAHGGKDGHPYKIRSKDYQNSIQILNRIISKAKIEHSDKIKVLRRLHKFYSLKV